MTKPHYVYSRNFGDTLTCTFGPASRYRCKKHLRDLRRNGRMTHFYIISTLNHEAASRRYLP